MVAHTTTLCCYAIILIAIICLDDSIAVQVADKDRVEDNLIQGPPRHQRLRRDAPPNKFKNFTRLIDSILDPAVYDKKLRPNFGGEPTTVKVNLNIRSVGPISEEDSMFQMDCYFRQFWTDERLMFQSEAIDKMVLSTHVLDKMWTPDTYIANGRSSYLHTITVQNMLIRISKDGSVYFSQRLTIRTLCPMQLRQYPLDYQTCKIHVGSFGYKKEDVILQWVTRNNESITLAENISTSQFELISISALEYNHSRLNDSEDIGSLLETSFHFKRSTGYYLLNIYIPCSMLVALSWVTFWLNREASAARVSLGILTILTMVTIAMSGRDNLPPLDYITALDLYLLMSLGFVLAAFVEYAGVNYFTKITKPDDCKPVYAYRPEELLPEPPRPEHDMARHRFVKKFLHCITGNVKYRAMLKRHRHEMNSVSVIDIVSRLVFPLTFIILNIVYWVAYVSYGNKSGSNDQT